DGQVRVRVDEAGQDVSGPANMRPGGARRRADLDRRDPAIADQQMTGPWRWTDARPYRCAFDRERVRHAPEARINLPLISGQLVGGYTQSLGDSARQRSIPTRR